MATLLANHDAFAGARLFKQFNGDEKSYRVATATLLTLPGTPFIYYGEEIGLAQAEPVQQDDQAIRGPMSWSANAQAGFTRGDKPFRPLVANWKTHNVEVETREPASLLNQYRQLIALRTSEPALAIGTFTPLSEKDAPILAFTREHQGSKLLVLINYAYRDAALKLPAGMLPAQWRPVFPADATWPPKALAPQKPAKPARASKSKKAAPATATGRRLRCEPSSAPVARLPQCAGNAAAGNVSQRRRQILRCRWQADQCRNAETLHGGNAILCRLGCRKRQAVGIRRWPGPGAPCRPRCTCDSDD